MSKMTIIRDWSDEELVNELRSGIRAKLGIDSYYLLMAEALARILERVKEPRP